MHTAFLTVHVICGGLGLLIGPLAMVVRKRPRRAGVHWHSLLGRTYQATVTGVCLSALGLVALKPSVWWLGVIAVATQAAAFVGWVTRPTARRATLSIHVGAMCGSYISFVTAFLVVNTDGLVWWFLPTIVGSPLIAWTSQRASSRYAVRAAI